VLEVLGVLAAVAVLVAVNIGRRPTRPELRRAAATVIGGLAVVFAIGGIASGASALNQARRASVSASQGTDYCFGQSWPGNPNGAGAARLPFVRWLRARMGADAVYAIDDASPPDVDCLYLGLLPALPARPGQRPDWTIAYGAMPPEMQAKIAAHDPAVRVFAPGYALQDDGGA
jgi:hypothetical protein